MVQLHRLFDKSETRYDWDHSFLPALLKFTERNVQVTFAGKRTHLINLENFCYNYVTVGFPILNDF